MITDSHFFENTHSSVVRCNPANTTNPHKDQNLQIKGKLLLILKLDTATIFVYEQYNIIINKNKIVDIQSKPTRIEKSAKQIIVSQLQSSKELGLNIGSDIEVIGYNPNECTKEDILSQTI
jgi:hypothetical protein